MSRADRSTILLSVAALCVTIIGTSCSTNARISDVNARISDLNADVNARFDAVDANMNARISDLNADMNARFDAVGARFGDVNTRFDDILTDIRELRALIIGAIKRDPPAAD